jgi:hypothetical protein
LHIPALHACPCVHGIPHPPQLPGSVWVSAQTPLHMTSFVPHMFDLHVHDGCVAQVHAPPAPQSAAPPVQTGVSPA